ncbi:hypothetical protein KVT40_009118 [Elsinoe batatas]|uniref:HMA domain-containing protein n=1 Tax=Elsinoe batatas TaxID=2601811 RepID=A0A8K0KVP4_9PEZI|nr:hypothetical protein KVT40_009118 [Elsinoe batatas]
MDLSKKGCCGSSPSKDCAGSRCDEECIRKIASLRCSTDNAHLRKSANNVHAASDYSKCENKCCESDTVHPSKPHSSVETKQTICGQVKTSCCSGDSDSARCCQELADGSVDTDKTNLKKQEVGPKGGCCGGMERMEPSGCCESSANASTENDPIIEDTCCDRSTHASNGTDKPSCCVKEPAGSACADHLQRTFDELSGLLGKGLCICRTVLDRLPTSCSSSQASIKAARKDVKKERGAIPKDKCCTAKSSISSLAVQEVKAGDEGCYSGKASQVNQPPNKSPEVCCFTESSGPVRSTCRSTLPPKSGKVGHVASPSAQSSNDGARGRSKVNEIEVVAAREHVLLNISGMTCTGCARKVMNILNGVTGISSPKVTFVSGVAEFDIESTATLRGVIDELEKGTGFSCSRIVSKYQSIDLLSTNAISMVDKGNLPDGIESVEKLEKGLYRVNYDPVIIGARILLSSFPSVILAPPSNDAMLREGKKHLINMGWSTITAATLTIPIVVLSWSDNPVPESTRLIVSLILGSLVQAIAVPEFYVGAVKSLVYSRAIEMDMLVVISITAACGYSVVAFGLHFAGIALVEEAFFETSALLITLVLLGRFMAALARVRAVSAVSIRSLQAGKALLVEASGEAVEIDARLLQFGDVFVVPPHSRVPTDGEVVEGSSSVDESMITGESIPVSKAEGDQLVAGTINGSSTLKVKLSRLPGKNSITDIAHMVENALGAKPRVQDLADKVASWFIPAVMAISAVVLVTWIAVCLRVRRLDGGDSFGVAITYSIAVLAVSCPCALGLAVPMVLVVAGGVTARQGVVVKSADAIERGHRVTDVVFDKTGTLTKGDLEVIHQAVFGHGEHEPSEGVILGAIQALIEDNEHPVSRAVAEAVKSRPSISGRVEEVESIPGSGIQGIFFSSTMKVGNPYWLGVDKHREIAPLIDQGMTLLCATMDGKLIASFGLKSNLRPEAAQVISELHRRQITCHIVSGDGPQVVRDVANSVGVPTALAMSRHKPADKQAYVQSLMDAGKHVLFCGDGTNDAIAVAQANVGVQIGNTSDVTKATASVVLLGGLDGVLVLLDVSKRSFRRIVFNFVWSAVYNVFAILLAAGAFVRVRIPPAYAGLGEIVSVLPVIVAAMTLQRTKKRTVVA